MARSGEVYLVLELCEGPDLQRLLDVRGAFQEVEVCWIIWPASPCLALASAISDLTDRLAGWLT